MNKTKLRNEIFNAIMTNGIMSSKDDIISNDPDDRVYTKRVNIGKDYCSKNFSFIEVACVSVTSDSKEMKDVTARNVRFNMKNPNGQWVNLFMHEAPKELLEFVHKNVVK
jgi:hypothetical protein